ncbi:IS3 family transposase [Amycolatopsis pithecellobii]|uniref:IS3 family transposase n=1 Tax=Amycolatopsis pithecellobii TaxID=664692 RepID=A0A6N7Z1B5_9PSEU|nr:IS3 family transposase [Amycolatopsis pithecellobii]MTD58142.1 IS3 family transposase [Amycolatopsis pithecellobii]
MSKNRRSFTPEYKEEAAKLVVESNRPVASVARELQVNEQTLRNWVNDYRKQHAGDEPALTVSERARLRELEKEVRELRMEKEFLGKSRGLLRERVPVSELYEFIEAEKDTVDDSGENMFTLAKMCVWLGVSKSGFYEWRSRPESATAQRRACLAELITKIFVDSDETYGHRRVHAQLARQGERCTPELVRGIMRELGLEPCQPRPWRLGLTDGSASLLPDLLARDFTATAPGEKMVGDITYIPTWEGWVYLATVIDCHTKAVIGWAMDDNYQTELIEKAIRMAVRNYNIKPGAIFHSDRGSNYMSSQFAHTLRAFGIRQSVGRTGICYDNSMAESFFGTLKNERVHRMIYPTRKAAMADIATYIELRYNNQRLHSGIDYKTPSEVYNEYLNRQHAA